MRYGAPLGLPLAPPPLPLGVLRSLGLLAAAVLPPRQLVQLVIVHPEAVALVAPRGRHPVRGQAPG
ncbi:MAG TPA: hypothetical protein VHR45_06360 [Thermoanaerobaculia bacterium]|nr:hypothetical protein [Thermoanaerobaculia bacterium]